VFFTLEDGSIRDCVELRASGMAPVPGVFHTFVALEPDTVVSEVKTGPYPASNDKALAGFRPRRGDNTFQDFICSIPISQLFPPSGARRALAGGTSRALRIARGPISREAPPTAPRLVLTAKPI